MKKLRIGVVGVGRGKSMMHYCEQAENAELVAICDKWEAGLERTKHELNDDRISYFTDYDSFLAHDMDCVMLANYANQHAPFAIKAMESGKHVISEVLPAQNMAEAVKLIETVEKTGMTYCYAENYCYMGAPREMRKLYRSGRLGTFEYGEGEYLHNCEPIWEDITYGERDHWRNGMSAFFYCTHSVGPLLHITGLRPKTVTGFEGIYNGRMARMGARAGHMALEIVRLENGALIKSIHGVGPSRNSVWYSIYGSKGRIESAREDAMAGDNNHVYEHLDDTVSAPASYEHVDELTEQGKKSGHGGSDIKCLYYAVENILGDKNSEIVDVYEAVDMWMVGQFGYFSALAGGVPVDIPDLRSKEERDRFRNDTRCTDPKAAGDMLLPSYSKGTPKVDEAVYNGIRRRWEEKEAKAEEKA